MRPHALKQTRRPRSDRGKARHSVSSSSSHHQGTSSHQHDDDDDVETSRASTPSPTTYLNSLNPLNYQNYHMPFASEQTNETLFERQTTLVNWNGYLTKRRKTKQKATKPDTGWKSLKNEHLAPFDSTTISPAVDHVPSAEETAPFETDESAATPPPPPAYRTTSRMSIRSQAPIPFPSEAEVDRLLALPTSPPSPLTPLSSPLP
ncbi:hypothetical protein Tco_0135047 [Tanacetum coccineum]